MMITRGKNAIGNKVDGICKIDIGQVFQIEDLASCQMVWVTSRRESLSEDELKFTKPGILYVRRETETDSGRKEYHCRIILCGIEAEYPSELRRELIPLALPDSSETAESAQAPPVLVPA